MSNRGPSMSDARRSCGLDRARQSMPARPGTQPAAESSTVARDPRLLTPPRFEKGSRMTRRDFYRFATVGLGGLIGLVLAVPGVAYIVSPLRKKGREESFETLTRLKQLEVGVPRSFAIIEERRDAWVKYPREPVGSVWLIRQPDGKASRGHRALVGVPPPGLRRQPDGRRQELPVPLPHQCIRPATGPRKTGPAPHHGSARGRADRGRRPRGTRQVPAVPDPERGADSP